MKNLKTYQVFPAIPEPLKFLGVLSRNLWWSWHMDAIELYRRIDPRLWRMAGRNPILFSTLIPAKRLEELAKDEAYLAQLDRVRKKFEKEVGPFSQAAGPEEDNENIIAYFSMEFGIHESLPLFAGGLGILAGDHLKAASDLDVPLVGVGLLYHQGYFHQYLDDQGYQQEEYPQTDIFHLPVSKCKDALGNAVSISIQGPDGNIRAIVWKVSVGRIPLYLLDTNIPENPVPIRRITGRLYTGESRERLAQEVLLGIGGMRALATLGIHPAACHMNEGHSAFCSLERLCQIKTAYGVDLGTAMEIVPRTTIFTTHTPVAAGHDEFPKELVKPYVTPMESCLGVSADEIISWGQPASDNPNIPLSMFVLGLRMSQYHNGVSELHGRVARRMWSHVWPGWPEDEVPIAHVTNGIHIPSWISIENAQLFERYLAPDWYLHSANADFSERFDQIYNEELWQARQMSRARLIRTCRTLMVNQYGRRNAPQVVMKSAETVLDQDVLTIGFARRFASYKRATLLLKDRERFKAMITSEKMPVQFIFAGKAHPKDSEAKEIVKSLIAFARDEAVRSRIIFLEDYDINIARYLIQGADVWLNTPRRPMEACGTSGMKAAVNGVLNVSILDGWWCEGYREDRGWAIGNGEEYPDHEYQDMIDSQALYNVLENAVIPTFYDRKNGETPVRWTQMMKASMKMAMKYFCTHRMVKAYQENYYREAAENGKTIVAEGARKARRLLDQRQRLLSLWKHIKINPPVRKEYDSPARKDAGFFIIGESFVVTAEVTLGDIQPEEVIVELYYGQLKTIDHLSFSQTQIMHVEQVLENGRYLFACSLRCEAAGRFGFTVRVSPKGDDCIRFTPGLISWA
jgi:starch phosphorylase